MLFQIILSTLGIQLFPNNVTQEYNTLLDGYHISHTWCECNKSNTYNNLLNISNILLFDLFMSFQTA